ncbi:hypothetical protein M011DRAFT_486546 [Sporormia fimetaria CBS 119925]|uniref:SET domain-containing protein n=1 Tax=Sporormia fimetaria CBS 119925 TaxID=1340428 RepID=A0A6A6VBH9_9PLEO|nr:hypothetical protein M011DRAFT_486546 [Sporormia fimetaria CBS 119925]
MPPKRTRTKTPSPANPHNLKLLQTRTKGLGLFTTSPIRKSTILLSFPPLLILPSGTDTISTLLTSFSTLPATAKRAYLSLHSHVSPSLVSELTTHYNAPWTLIPAIEKHVIGVWRTNCWECRDGTSVVYGLGSRVNHSCTPSAVRRGDRFVSLRKLEMSGEEVTVDYVGGWGERKREEGSVEGVGDYVWEGVWGLLGGAVREMEGNEVVGRLRATMNIRRLASILSFPVIFFPSQHIMTDPSAPTYYPDFKKYYESQASGTTRIHGKYQWKRKKEYKGQRPDLADTFIASKAYIKCLPKLRTATPQAQPHRQHQQQPQPQPRSSGAYLTPPVGSGYNPAKLHPDINIKDEKRRKDALFKLAGININS